MTTISCYLIGVLDGDGRIFSVTSCGESPEQMTRQWRNGVVASEMVTLCVGEGDNYTLALESAGKTYALLFPHLARRFPWESFR